MCSDLASNEEETCWLSTEVMRTDSWSSWSSLPCEAVVCELGRDYPTSNTTGNVLPWHRPCNLRHYRQCSSVAPAMQSSQSKTRQDRKKTTDIWDVWHPSGAHTLGWSGTKQRKSEAWACLRLTDRRFPSHGSGGREDKKLGSRFTQEAIFFISKGSSASRNTTLAGCWNAWTGGRGFQFRPQLLPPPAVTGHTKGWYKTHHLQRAFHRCLWRLQCLWGVSGPQLSLSGFHNSFSS